MALAPRAALPGRLRAGTSGGRESGPARAPGAAAARPEQPDFARGLARFARTGAVTQVLKMQLRYRARFAACPHRPQAAGLLDYCISRGTDLGPVGPDFGGACGQIDRADAMLAGLRDRARRFQRHVRR